MTTIKRLRLVLIGWGAIAQTVAALVADEPVEIVAVAVRDLSSQRPNLPKGAHLISDPSELAKFKPNLVAEAAGRESVAPWGHAALRAGSSFVVSSVSAFADEVVLGAMRKQAAALGQKVIVQPGALAGVEALTAAGLMGIDSVEHRIVKPPKAWLGTLAESLCDLESLKSPEVFFRANAAETAAAFPKNANVAMTTAMAGIGPSATMVTLVADPNATTNRHELKAHGAFGTLDVGISNSPLPANPKTSALAALSLARCIQNHVAPIVI